MSVGPVTAKPTGIAALIAPQSMQEIMKNQITSMKTTPNTTASAKKLATPLKKAAAVAQKFSPTKKANAAPAKKATPKRKRSSSSSSSSSNSFSSGSSSSSSSFSSSSSSSEDEDPNEALRKRKEARIRELKALKEKLQSECQTSDERLQALREQAQKQIAIKKQKEQEKAKQKEKDKKRREEETLLKKRRAEERKAEKLAAGPKKSTPKKAPQLEKKVQAANLLSLEDISDISYKKMQHVVYEFAVRWHYALPHWPPANMDYASAL